MKLLVIGRSGQLARSLVERVPSADLAISAAGRPDCDVTRRDSVAAAVAAAKPDLVVNAAAYTQVDRAEAEVAEAFAINAEGAGHIGSAAAAAGVPVIHVSTDYVYDGQKTAPYVETDPVAPINAYGRSKLAGEQALAAAQPQHVILRSAWVFSPFGSNFVHTMLRLAAERPKVRVVADQFGNPTSAADLADAIIAIARQIVSGGPEAWGVYHAAAEGETSWHGLAEAVFAEAAKRGHPVPEVEPIATADYPTPARRPANSRLDCGKLAATFGFRLPDWREGVASVVSQLVLDEAASARLAEGGRR